LDTAYLPDRSLELVEVVNGFDLLDQSWRQWAEFAFPQGLQVIAPCL
jgi:hypothetical protein